MNKVPMTVAGEKSLREELNHLKGEERPRVIAAIAEAREHGDLKENAGYHAARDELGKVDGRIQQLTDMLQRAQVGETPADDGVVEPGMKVKVLLLGVDLEQEFLFGAREMAGDDVTVYSPQSPLGAAINGASKGDTVSYEAPNGKTLEVIILDAEPYTG